MNRELRCGYAHIPESKMPGKFLTERIKAGSEDISLIPIPVKLKNQLIKKNKRLFGRKN